MYSNFWSVRRNTLASMAGANERGGGAGGEREEKKSLTLSSRSPSPFPSFPIPYPFQRLLPGLQHFLIGRTLRLLTFS